jgi:carbon monoxide dehydrogenase subunit G
MLPVSVSASIDVPRERVFSFLSDLADRPGFTDHFIDGYHLERIPSSGVGAAARFRVGPATARIWMETVIEELEPPYLINERGRGGRLDRIPVFTGWALLAGAGSTTELTLTFWTEPSHPLDRLRERLGARRWYRRNWSRSLRRLKQRLETGESIEPARVAGEDRVPTLPGEVRHY